MVASSSSPYSTGNKPVATESEQFKINYDSPCCNAAVTRITPSDIQSPPPDNYSGTDIVFDYAANPYTVTPDLCETTIECVGVNPPNPNLQCINLDAQGRLVWNFPPSLYTDRVNGLPPGKYRYTYNVKTCANVAFERFTVDITLLDPCKTQGIQTVPDPQDIIYTITDPGPNVILFPKFSSSPDICRRELTIDLDPSNGLPGITFDKQKQEIQLPTIVNSLAQSG